MLFHPERSDWYGRAKMKRVNVTVYSLFVVLSSSTCSAKKGLMLRVPGQLG